MTSGETQQKQTGGKVEAQKMENVNDYLREMQAEIQTLKDGKMDVQTFRALTTARRGQLRALELVIQAARLAAKFDREIPGRTARLFFPEAKPDGKAFPEKLPTKPD